MQRREFLGWGEVKVMDGEVVWRRKEPGRGDGEDCGGGAGVNPGLVFVLVFEGPSYLYLV